MIDRRDAERRSGKERRVLTIPVTVERRRVERRTGVERRAALQSTGDQLRIAHDLLLELAESVDLNDEQRRLLDTAILRLRFAIDQVKADPA